MMTLTRCSSTPSVEILVKAVGSTRRTRPARVPGPAPAFDDHLGTRLNFDGIRAEHVDDDLEVTRIADFDQRGAGSDYRFAFLQDLEDRAGHGRRDIPTVGQRGAALLIAREQRLRLFHLVLGSVIQEFGGSQIPIGDPHGKFLPLKRLRGGSASLKERARAVEVGLRLGELRIGSIDRGFGALAPSFRRTKTLLRFPAATRIEKRGRRRPYRCNRLIRGNGIADLEGNAGRAPAERSYDDVAFAHSRFPILVDRRHKPPSHYLGCFNEDGARHKGPGDHTRGRDHADSKEKSSQGQPHRFNPLS